MKPTTANARRWLAARVDMPISTLRVRANGMKWSPGPRALKNDPAGGFMLDCEPVAIGEPGQVVIAIDGERLVIEEQDADGVQVHVTTYRA
jgi:hypothetical protein